MIGIAKRTNKIKWFKRLLLLFIIFVSTTGNIIDYDTLFYDVYRCNFDEENEYWVVEKNNSPTIEELIKLLQIAQIIIWEQTRNSLLFYYNHKKKKLKSF